MAFAKIVRCLLSGDAFDLYGDGTQSRSWTYVADVVEATIAAMERGSGTYNVGGGVEASLNDAVSILERLSARRLDVRYHPLLPGDQRRTSADTARIRADLGWMPRVSLEEGLGEQWRWSSARVGTA
jgi:UDP-glucose 4-epimerase